MILGYTHGKTAMTPETEVERLLKAVLPGSPMAGKMKAVGGYVRDQYLSHLRGEEANPKDLDIVVDDGPGGGERAAKFVHEKFPEQTHAPRNMGKGYPIWQLVFFEDTQVGSTVYETKGAVAEFADTMQESYPDENSRQRDTLPATLDEDIKRRDFTVNMLLKDLTSGEVEDLTGTSKKDVENGVLRGHPEVSLDKIFHADPLRMLRLVRFNAKYGWQVPRDVIRAVQRNAERIKIMSHERVLQELDKILKMGKLHQAVKFMGVCGLLDYILPEIKALKGVAQDSRHHNEGDVYRHTMLVLKNAPLTYDGQLAALLHDIGKPSSQEFIGDRIKFIGHEKVGAEMAESLLKRLRFPHDVVSKVTKIVRMHMRPHNLDDDHVTEKVLRKFITEMGDLLEDVLAQAEADRRGSLPYTDKAQGLSRRIRDIQEKDKNLGDSPSKLPLSGLDIMESFNIPRGPMVRRALELLQEIKDDYLTQGRVLDRDTAILELRKVLDGNTVRIFDK